MRNFIVMLVLAGFFLLSNQGCVRTRSFQPGVKSIEIIRNRDRTLDWCARNDLIAFSLEGADGYYDIATMNPDGTDVKVLTSDNIALPDKHISNPVWHPSGEYIVMQVEKDSHFGSSVYSTPGIGFNCDLYVINSDGKKSYRLTRLPTKERWRDDNNITGVLHPHFSHNGKNLVWGQLLDYKAKPGRSNQSNMGIWEMKVADFKVDDIGIGLENIRTYAPGRQKKWYETHGFSPNDKKIIFSGSLVPGQLDVYMDIYTFDLFTEELTRLTRTLNKWDEHAHYFPDGKRIVWISSVNKFDPDNWRKTLRTEYFVMNADGSNKQQLTFFNTPGHDHSRIFNGQRVIVADSAFNSDGTELMASIAVEGETCYCENNAG